MPTLAELPEWFTLTVAVALGAVLASFGNVVIHRLPRGLSLVTPASACPHCGKPIAPYDNIPLLSWLVLRGKARCCGTRISPRYFFLELMGALLGWALVEVVAPSWPGELPLWQVFVLILTYLVMMLGLVCAAFIDLEHMVLPDEITLGGAVLGLVSVPLRPGADFASSAVGALVGFMIVWLPFHVLYRKLRGHAGMGLGDAKLLMLSGAWLGWPGAVFALLAGAIQGTLAALAVFAARGRIDEPRAVKEEREALRQELLAAPPEEQAALLAELADDPVLREPEAGLGKARVPFGPFLVLGTLEYLLCGDLIVSTYLEWVGLR